MPSLLPYHNKDCLEFGLDEAGRGSLLSCVTAAAVYFDPSLEIPAALNDTALLRSFGSINVNSCSVLKSSTDFFAFSLLLRGSMLTSM